jgi:hypothetical protein
VIAI